MKKIITLAAALFALNAFAINPSTTWHSRGETLKYVGMDTSLSGFDSKEDAVAGVLALAEDFQSGSLSKHAKAVLRNARPLWDTDDKCQSTGMNLRIIEAEMAKGRFEVIRINVGSYFTAAGTEVFNTTMRFYAPCVKKQRD